MNAFSVYADTDELFEVIIFSVSSHSKMPSYGFVKKERSEKHHVFIPSLHSHCLLICLHYTVIIRSMFCMIFNGHSTRSYFGRGNLIDLRYRWCLWPFFLGNYLPNIIAPLKLFRIFSSERKDIHLIMNRIATKIRNGKCRTIPAIVLTLQHSTDSLLNEPRTFQSRFLFY